MRRVLGIQNGAVTVDGEAVDSRVSLDEFAAVEKTLLEGELGVEQNEGVDQAARKRHRESLSLDVDPIVASLFEPAMDGERLFVSMADPRLHALPLEAARSFSTGRLVTLESTHPHLIRTFGEGLADRPAFEPGQRLDMALIDATGLFLDEHVVPVRSAVEDAGGSMRPVARIADEAGLDAEVGRPSSIVLFQAHGADGGAAVEIGAGTTRVDEVAERLVRMDPSVVLLGVCGGSSAEAGGGLAAALIDRGVPIVVAARHDVFSQSWAAFVEGLVVSLASANPVDAAVRHARVQMGALGNGPAHTAVLSLYASVSDLSGPAIDPSRRVADAVMSRMADRRQLPLKQIGHDEQPSPAAVLRPEARTVPLIGRDDELASLRSWLDDPEPCLSYAVVGEGGEGKTRLGWELVAAAATEGWSAGFLGWAQTDAAAQAEIEALAAAPGDRLVVVDYAEHRPGLVRQLFDGQFFNPDDRRLRLLLLMRQKVHGPNWWSPFVRDNDGEDFVSRLKILELTEQPLSPEERQEIEQQCRARFASGSEPLALHAQADPDGPRGRTPLEIACTVLAEEFDRREGTVAAEDDPFGRVVEHELRYVRRRAAIGGVQVPEDRLEEALLVSILADARTPDRLAELIAVVRAEGGEGHRAVAEKVCTADPAGLRSIDRLKERLAVRCAPSVPGLIATLVPALTPLESSSVLEIIGRAAGGAELPGAGAALLEHLGRMRGLATREPMVEVALGVALGAPMLLDDDQIEQVLARFRHDRAAGDRASVVSLNRLRFERCAEAVGSDDPATIKSLNNYAYCLRAVGRAGDALPLFEQALTQCRDVLGETHPDTIKSLNNYAGCLETVGRAGDALPLFEQALTQRRDVLGETHPDTIKSLNNYAGCLETVGRAGDALPLFEQALRQRRDVLGDTHPDTIASLNNYAYCLETVGRAGDALPLYEQALTQRRDVLGDAHPDTIASLNNYAYCLETVGRAGDALPLFEQALRQCRDVLGDTHPDTISSLNNYAGCLETVGRAGEALPLYEQALRQRRDVLGDAHPDTITSLNNYAYCLQAVGRAGDALPLFEQALRQRRELLGDTHPDTIGSLNNYAYCLYAVGRAGEALPLYEQALTQHRDVFGDSHPGTITSLNNYAHCLETVGRAGDAVLARKQALLVTKAANGWSHRKTRQARRRLWRARLQRWFGPRRRG